MQQLFPSEAVENSVESYLPVVSTRSQIIYFTIVCSVIAIILSLPFIYVDVSTSANGQIQARVERQDVIIPVNGFLTKIDLKENMLVKKDSIILTIDERSVDKQADIHTNRLSEYRNYLGDISILLAGGDSPKTPYYKASLLQYKEALSEAKTRVGKLKIDMERSQQLFQEKVIAASEFENIKLSYDQSVSSLNMVTQKQRNVWESEALNYKEQIRTIESSALQLAEEKRRYTIKAPISGNIQQLQGLQLGSYVREGQKIAEITPDTGIMVQCYVPPSDIGLIKVNQTVFLRVDVFNYNEWGILKGKVSEIASDIVLVGSQQQPTFKVRCSISSNFLQLKNGYRGYLQKGMSVHARFIIARRSLFQLLYDKVDNWLNPATNT